MKKISKIGIIGTIFLVLLFLFSTNTGVVADQGPYLGFTAGTYGNGNDNTADPTTRGMQIEASHTQDASLDNIFVQVYVVNTGDNALVRVAISKNGGTSFSDFEWVNNEPTVKQDYPDVQLYEDTSDNDAIKAIVVWQEKPDDDSNEWQIKCRERCFNSNTWGVVHTVSDNMGQYENLYPKVSTCSDNSYSYWNVVWQEESSNYANRFGVNLKRFVRDSQGDYWKSVEPIAQPNNSSENYKHPATDCIAEDYEIVYVLYDQYNSWSTVDNQIKLAYGSPLNDKDGNIQLTYSIVDSSTGGDYSQDYPDIAAVKDGQNNILDCVWVENDDNNYVKHKRSTTGGGIFGSEYQVDDDGDMNLRSVAVDSYVLAGTPHDIKRCHIIWTTGSDVYYRDLIDDNYGCWKSTFEDIEDGATTIYDEYFVDVSTSSPSSGTITAYAVWGVDGTAVFFGTG